MAEQCFSTDLAESAGLAVNRFPETSEEIALAERTLAKELQKLSLDEKEKILFDVHGIARTIHEEDPETLDATLEQLETEIQKITNEDRQAYDRAKSLNPLYVNDRKFRLMFLRAEEFDPKAAADMMIRHFVAKRKLFGDGEILARDVRLSDLGHQERAILELGFLQVLSSRDAAGRTVLAMSTDFREHATNHTLMVPITRACWYFNMAQIKDEETQKKGTVIITYNYGGYVGPVNLDNTIHSICSAMPRRVDAEHFCANNDPKIRTSVTGIQLFVHPKSRFRLRSHFGTPKEVNFELQTYGIDTECSPMQTDGTWSTEFHHQWLAIQEVREVQPSVPAIDQSRTLTSQDTIIDVPLKFDVLFGKGKKERMHTGNLRAMHLCDMHWDKYEKANKFGKTLVAEQIVDLVHESGGRFLKAGRKGGWLEVNDLEARPKIAHFFRFKRSKAKSSSPQSSDDEFENSLEPNIKVNSTAGVKRGHALCVPRTYPSGTSLFKYNAASPTKVTKSS